MSAGFHWIVTRLAHGAAGSAAYAIWRACGTVIWAVAVAGNARATTAVARARRVRVMHLGYHRLSSRLAASTCCLYGCEDAWRGGPVIVGERRVERFVLLRVGFPVCKGAVQPVQVGCCSVRGVRQHGLQRHGFIA